MPDAPAEPLRHLLNVDQLSDKAIELIMEGAGRYRDGRNPARAEDLRGRRVALLFAEASTRTRLSFEIAARNLAAETFRIEPLWSSMVKGETLVDTVRNFNALGFDILVLRHHRAGAPWVAARHFGGAVVNAGDGWHAHPTQALLDLLTLRRAFGGADELRGRKVVIVGDVRHSRVARSNIHTLTRAGVVVWLCGPEGWLRGFEQAPVTLTTELADGLRDADAVMGLRVQRERMRGDAVSADEYVARYQVTEERLQFARPDAPYLHPGPINEGVEVTREVARGPRSLVLEQVRNGVAVRMSVLALLQPREQPARPHATPRRSPPRATCRASAGSAPHRPRARQSRVSSSHRRAPSHTPRRSAARACCRRAPTARPAGSRGRSGRARSESAGCIPVHVPRTRAARISRTPRRYRWAGRGRGPHPRRRSPLCRPPTRPPRAVARWPGHAIRCSRTFRGRRPQRLRYGSAARSRYACCHVRTCTSAIPRASVSRARRM